MDNKTSIQVTDSAIKKIHSVINNETPYFRIFVTGGGCSGFKYGFTLDVNKEEDDIEIKKDDISILIDSISFPYINESVLNYKETLMESNFEIENPNATATCGCGESFTI